MDENKSGHGTFVNSAGRTYKVIGLPQYTLTQIQIDLTEKWRVEGHPLPESPPPLPTYTAETAGGGTETYPLDKESLETDEEKTLWADYILKKNEYETTMARFVSEYNQQLFDESCQCVDADPMKDKDFVDWAEFRKTKLPTNRAELKQLYVRTWVLRNVTDIAMIQSSVMIVSEITTEEAVKVHTDNFRRTLENALSGRGAGADPAGGVGSSEQPLDV